MLTGESESMGIDEAALINAGTFVSIPAMMASRGTRVVTVSRRWSRRRT